MTEQVSEEKGYRAKWAHFIEATYHKESYAELYSYPGLGEMRIQLWNDGKCTVLALNKEQLKELIEKLPGALEVLE